MSPQRTRLEILRNDLDQIEIKNYRDWSEIEVWAAKATQIIQSDYSEQQFNQFRSAIRKPSFLAVKIQRGPPDLIEHREIASLLQNNPGHDLKLAQQARRKILNFLDGLLLLPEVSKEQIETQKSAGEDIGFKNPTDLNEIGRHLSKRQWIALVIAALIIVPIVVSLITTGLPILFREPGNKPLSNSTENINVANKDSSNASNDRSFKGKWAAKLESDGSLDQIKASLQRFAYDFKDLQIFFKTEHNNGKFYILAVCDSKESANAYVTIAHNKWGQLGYEKAYKNSAETVYISFWCGDSKISTDNAYYTCSKDN
jgi:hypothetical protein